MIDTTWVDMSHGLSLNEGPHSHRDNENGVLFYLEYILLKEARGQDITDDLTAFRTIVENIRAHGPNGSRIYGLYDRGADESLQANKDEIRVISHDNLTAIAAFDARYGLGYEATLISKFGIRNILRYDNAYPSSPRWKTVQWPTDWAFWVMSSSNPYLKVVAWQLMPLFVIRSIAAMFGNPTDTSGRLLDFVRFASHRDKSLLMNLMWKLFVRIQVNKYGNNWLHEIMHIYFQNPNHPLHSLSDNVEF